MKRFRLTLVAVLLVFSTLMATACDALLPAIEIRHSDTMVATGDDTVPNAWETVTNTVSPAGGVSFAEYISEQNLPVGEEFENDGGDEEFVVDVYEYAINLLAFDLSRRGFEVYEGIATDAGGSSYIGLVFLEGTDTYNADGFSISTAGFICLVEDASDMYLTDDQVSRGVVAVVGEETFLVDRFLNIDGFSGVVDDFYFTYRQVAPYAVSISVEEVTEATAWDYTVDCYDFNENRTLWFKDITRPSLSASSLYSEDEAYNAIVQSVRDMVAIQEDNYYQAERSLFVIIDPAILDALSRGDSVETINDYLVSELNSLELEENQFLVLSATEGVQVIEVADFDEMVARRRSGGWMQVALSSVMLLGSVVIACVSFGSSTPAVVTSIACVSGAVASVVAVSNLVEGIDNVRLANLGDIVSPANNPVRDEFVKAFGEKGVTIYNAVGITAMTIQSLMIPVGGGLKLASEVCAGAFQTVIIVGRAVLVTVVEGAIIGAASTAVALRVEREVLEKTGDQSKAQWCGLGAGFAVGILGGVGSNMLDRKFNFSGLYTKPEIVARMYQQNRTKAIAKMAPSTWSDMSVGAQKRAANQLAKFIAKEMGLKDVPKIKYYFKEPGKNSGISYGYFNPNDGSINLNLYVLDDSLGVVDTIAHEMSHARHYQWIKQGVNNELTQSFQNYITPDSNYEAYRNQACERDAYHNGEAWKAFAKSDGKALDWTAERNDGLTTLEHIHKNHTNIKATKPQQGVYDTADDQVIQSIIEDAWLRRGVPCEVKGDKVIYMVPTKDCGAVYLNGSYVGRADAIRIVVYNDNVLSSAYPAISALFP